MSPQFCIGGKALVHYENFYYLAKILDITEREGKLYYYVKYYQFSQAYNEEVEVDRMKEATPEAIGYEQERKSEYNRSKKKSSTTKSKAKTQTPVSEKTREKKQTVEPLTKRQRTEGLSESSLQTKPVSHTSTQPRNMTLKISNVLRKILWEDFEASEFRQIKVPPPYVPSTAVIIADYLAALQAALALSPQEGGANDNRTVSTPERIAILDQSIEVLIGVRAIFDKVLCACLLHRKERTLYDALVKEHPHYEDNPSLAYGLEHLIRLFVKLPVLLFTENMNNEELREIEERLNDFLTWLSQNYKAYKLKVTPTSGIVESQPRAQSQTQSMK